MGLGASYLAALASANVTGWIHGFSRFQHFKVNMRPGRTTAAAHSADHVASFHALTRVHKKLLMVAIARSKIFSVTDLDEFAVS